MEEIKRKTWFGRNWLWVLPVGGCLTFIVLLVLGIGTIFFGVSKVLTSSMPYKYALEQASENIRVTEVLGEPIEADGIINGNISVTKDHGEANFTIPIVGPNGKAKVVVIAQKTEGTWTYETLYVLIKRTQEKINLLYKDLEGI